MTALSIMISLPAAVVSKGSGIGSSLTATATAATATTTTPAAVTAVATAAATAVADHLGETGINLLLGLSKDSNQVTSLLRVWGILLAWRTTGNIWTESTYCQW